MCRDGRKAVFVADFRLIMGCFEVGLCVWLVKGKGGVLRLFEEGCKLGQEGSDGGKLI